MVPVRPGLPWQRWLQPSSNAHSRGKGNRRWKEHHTAHTACDLQENNDHQTEELYEAADEDYEPVEDEESVELAAENSDFEVQLWYAEWLGS